MSEFPEEFDYVVVGAGSAGCVVAGRLSANPSVRVLLIEAGPEPRSPWIKIPGAVSKVIGPSKYNWAYTSEPEPSLGGRRIYWPRGRTLGGSGAINGMVYLRGHRLDFDDWQAMGNRGWSWADVVPFFRRAEDAMGISEAPSQYEFSKLFVAAAQDAGFAFRPDFNDDDPAPGDGVGFLRFSIRRGMRCSAYDAFIAPVRGRRNLTLVTGAFVERVDFEGRRAAGVTLVKDGRRRSIAARREVVLSGGAVNSPQLLMLSGIGPAEHLGKFGIEVLADRGGVGSNLHDHTNTPLVYSAPAGYSINHRVRGARLALEVGRYIVRRTGIMAVGTSGASAFAKVDSSSDRPDIQISVRPFSFVFGPDGVAVAKSPTVTVSVYQMRPESRGSVRLKSGNPADAPLIQANFLQSEYDQSTVVAGVRLAQRLMTSPLMAHFAPVARIPLSDAELLEGIRDRLGPVFHPVSTCRMGPDSESVVDERLRVRGVERLRVADASIMPIITSTNINAACIMIGEKAADLISEDGARV